MKKKLLSLTAFLLLLVTLAFSASAANIKEFKSKSTFTPVSYSSHKAVSEVTLYGNADYLCMKAAADTNKKDIFCIEIYSDSKRTKQILSYSNTFKKGTTYEDILFDLTSLKSKTYYATSYVMKESSFIAYGYNIKKDPDTVKNFKIIVKRDGTSIKNMKCIVYGYENTFYGPAVYWYSVPGATKYYVYKYTDSKYKKIATVDATDEEFSFYVDETLKSKNVTRYYKIKAVKGSSATALSEKLKVVTLKAPTVKAEVAEKGNGINVTWSKPKSGCSYTVFRAVNDDEWKEVVTTTSTKYFDSNVKTGNTYYYTVVAKSSNAVSGYDPNGAECFFLSSPSNTKAESSDGNMVITWKAVSGADGYKVYKKLYTESEWTFIGETKETTFTDTEAEKNTLYSYGVRASKSDKLSGISGGAFPFAMFDAVVVNDIEINEKGRPVVTWEATEGVQYNVMRKEEGSAWTEVKIVNGNSFVDESGTFANGKKYYYTVKPGILVRFEDEYETYSLFIEDGYDKIGKDFIYYAPISSLAVTGTASGVELTWAEVGNVNGYNIYRKTAETEYELIGTSETAKFEDNDILPEIEYSYKVTYNVGEEEMTECFAETKVKISSEYVVLSDDLKVFDKYYSSWSFKIKNFSPEDTYRIFVRTEEGWQLYATKKTSDGTISLSFGKATEKNEFAIIAVKKDGTITSFPETGFILDPFEFNVTHELDYENCAANLSWNAVEGAEKYNIYSSDKKELLMTLGGDVTSAVVPSLEPTEFYHFVVSAVKDDIEVKITTDRYYLYAAPHEITAKQEDEGVQLRWFCDGHSNDYQVYRKTNPDAEWVKIADVKATTRSYYDKSVEDGTVYYYAVKSGDVDEGKFSAYSESVKFAYILPTEITKVTTSKTSVKISWKKSSVADYYQVYRKESGGSWKRVYTTDSGDVTTYTDKKAKAGTGYYYSVRVCKDGERSEGAKVFVKFLAAPTNVKAAKSGSNVKLTFTPSKGAAAHYIYRKTGNGSWKQVAKVGKSAKSYTDTTAGSGKNYYYVQAIFGNNISPKSSTVSIKK